MDTNMDLDTECIISNMECNIHIDTNMDMNMVCIISHMECGDIITHFQQ